MIDGTATIATARTEYGNTATPFSSVTQCERFIRACAILVVQLPSEAGSREGNVRHQVELIQKQQTDAQAWLAANGGATQVQPQRVVVRPDFRNFRSC